MKDKTTLANKFCNKMTLNLYVASLNQCSSSSLNTIPYGQVKIHKLDAFVAIGDFVLYYQVVFRRVLRRIIDENKLADIAVEELSMEAMENKNGTQIYALIHVWDKVESSHSGYHRLDLTQDYSLRGIEEVMESWRAL